MTLERGGGVSLLLSLEAETLLDELLSPWEILRGGRRKAQAAAGVTPFCFTNVPASE